MFNLPHSKDHGNRTGFIPGGKLEVLLFWAAMAYFGGKAMFFAVRIKERVFPDEASWFGIAQVFSRSAWLPVDSPESYPFGLVTHIPSLYFFLMGKALVLNILPVSDLIFLRLLNVGMGLLTIYFAWRLICLLTDLVAARLLFLAMLTNTLMVTFLFGAVSYDNLVNLLAVMAFYYFCVFWLRREVMALLFAIIAVLAGCLTKLTFLPLLPLFALALLWQERKHIRDLPHYFKTIFSPTLRYAQLLVWLTIVVMAGAGLKLYGGNWLRYSQLSPSQDSVLSLANALKYRIFTRSYAVGNYKSGRLSFLDAQRLVLQIREESDRHDCLNLLEIAREAKLNKTAAEPALGRLQYTVVWLWRVLPQLFGIMAHKNMLKESWAEVAPYYVVLGGALLGFLMRLKAGRAGLMNCSHQLFLVSIGYLLILMQFVNYAIYQASGVMVLALQGRYTFPVLVPVYLLCAYYFVVAWSPRFRMWSAATVGAFFVFSEFPWFLQRVTPDWFF